MADRGGAPREVADACFDDLAETYRSDASRLRRIFVRHGFRNDADDLVQDAFARLAVSAPPDRPPAYLTRIAVNLVRDQIKRLVRRRAAHMVMAEVAGPSRTVDPVLQLEARDMLARLEQAMLRLKPKTREIFMAHRLDGLTYAQIAAATGLSVKAVEKQMSYAIARIDDLMSPR